MANDTVEAFLQPKTEATAAWLNILFVGLGNVYAGELDRGLIMISVSVAIGGVAYVVGGAALLLIVPYWIWAFTDGRRAAREYNQRLTNIAAQKQRAEEEAKAQAAAAKISGSDLLTGMKKLHQLHEAQIITAEEFEQKKATLIAEVQVRGIREAAEDFRTMLIPLLQQGVLSQAELGKLKQAVM